MKERWLPVVGFERLYAVSNHGRIKTIGSGSCRKVGHIHKVCIASTGYPVVSLRTLDHCHHQRYVHRLVMAAFVGPCSEGWQVNHKDGKKPNNRLGNLEYATPQQNNAHQNTHGLRPRGTRNGNAKLTEGTVKVIRSLAVRGFSYSQIAYCFDRSKSCVAHIVSGRAWR